MRRGLLLLSTLLIVLAREPGIWYLSGRGTYTVNEDGNLTSFPAATGKLVNLCARLAP